jgi:EEF1A lysine methyltransferase 2
MLGVDYSARSVELARRIEEDRQAAFADEEEDPVDEAQQQQDEYDSQDDDDDDISEAREPVEFARHDILLPPPPAASAPAAAAAATEDADAASAAASPSAWPVLRSGAQTAGWDVVLDKGTFDAVSLSSAVDARGRRTSERRYRGAALRLVRPGGLLLITSCNWTEEELAAWFVGAGAGDDSDEEGPAEGARFEKVGRIEYRSFSFGGVKGQTISTLCFRKVVG